MKAGADELFPAIEQLLAVKLVAVFAADLVEQDGLASGVAFTERVDVVEPAPGGGYEGMKVCGACFRGSRNSKSSMVNWEAARLATSGPGR